MCGEVDLVSKLSQSNLKSMLLNTAWRSAWVRQRIYIHLQLFLLAIFN